ncbi:MAG: threonylcarbamoyl-AMP synthase [Actinobacteria bacterium]|nr:threonylcarbamoyl-AMP synthase [Actinomycetota bacterium]
MSAQILLPDAVDRAGAVLAGGGLVAFPTETVYGLGADALSGDAVGRIFRAKGRPADNPLIVHLADAGDLGRVAGAVPSLARRLAAEHWPGPLTLVLEAHPDVPSVTTGGLRTVAVRVPDHPVARALITAAGVPVAAPSANRSGRPSPTTAAHVLADLGDAVDVVVDGGACRVGVESTVVDARGGTPVVLREGSVTREMLGLRDGGPAGELEASPGTRYRHYAPTCDVVVADATALHDVVTRHLRAGARVGLVASTRRPVPDGAESVARFGDAAELASLLYRALRDAEDAGVDVLVVEAVDETDVGRAVMDRLRRAAAG